jgi:spore maturation protein CgeB
MKRILYVGNLFYGGTCLQRLTSFKELGYELDSIDTALPKVNKNIYLALRILWRLGFHPDLSGANQQIISQTQHNVFDLVWIDKGLTISAKTLLSLKKIQPSCLLVSYHPDDVMNPRNISRKYTATLPCYDFVITNRECNIEDLNRLGAKTVIRMDFSYDPHTHRPINLTHTEKQKFGGDVGFTGTFEMERYKSMLRIAKTGQEVVVRGTGWEALRKRHPLLSVQPGFLAGDDYAKAICATQINLGFLRKGCRDLHTQRSFEIPACGGFLLAERTSEHLKLFEEGKEAEFFETDEELIDKVKYYLQHESERRLMAQAGRERCLNSGYSYRERIKSILDEIYDN